MTAIHYPHDRLFKQGMADIRVAKEFFECYLPEDVLDKIDLATLKEEKSTFINEKYQLTESDLLYSVAIKDTLMYLHLLTEHQSENDNNMAYRFLVYQVGIMDKHRKQYPQSPPPVVYPMVVYSGKKPWTAARHFFELYGELAPLARRIFLQPYPLIDLHRIADAELRQRILSGLIELSLKYRRPKDPEALITFLNQCFPWIQNLYADKMNDKLIKIVYSYIVDGIQSDNKPLLEQKIKEHLSGNLRENVMTFAQAYRQEGIELGKQEGIELGKQEGIQLGKRCIVKRLLAAHYDITTIVTLTELTREEILALKAEEALI